MSVGYVSDKIYQQHDTGDHVEGKDRLTAIESVLEKTGVKEELTPVAARPATIDEIAAVHDRDYINSLKCEIEMGGGWLDPDTYASRGSWDAALYAAGGLMNAVDAVMDKAVDSAFALVRPPGHHAVRSHQMGFCLFNNVAIAAKFALHNFDIKRVLIIDFDVHHGNGTQEAFYSDNQVLYFSTHEYPWYPFTGSAEETGRGSGLGYNVNVPLEADLGDKEYLQVFNEILTPVTRRFAPDLMLVSAGYDAHWQDTISNMNVTTMGFAKMAKVLKAISDEVCLNRLVCTLEGGYNRTALAYSVAATIELMLGHAEVQDPLGAPPMAYSPRNFDGFIQNIRNIHNLSGS
jgi:acetoin utilization deacetylase AcuC-like enzyme